jgi:RluA family pseudouridine synthase
MITFGSAPLEIAVLALGKGWIVVDKPAGLSVHNEAGQDLCSLASDFVQKEKDIQAELGVELSYGIHPVHRLDKETSGVILLAVNRDVFRFFSHQFESRQVKKRYVALLHGFLPGLEGDDPWGAWLWPLSSSAGGRDNPEGLGRLQDSRTRYRVLHHSAHYTMVEIELLSGRVHQIRRHAKLAGHPVVGDARYGSVRAINYLKRNHGFERLALHAQELTLTLPGKKEPTTVKTLAIPHQMQELFENDVAAPE